MEIINRDNKIEKFVFSEKAFKAKKKKIDYEFQQLGIELEPLYGKAIWAMFYKWPLVKIKDAHKVCVNKGITKIPFLIGVMKNLK